LTILKFLLIPNFRDTTNTKNYNQEILLLGKHVKITKEQNISLKISKLIMNIENIGVNRPQLGPLVIAS
jgi:DNA-binding transcriptional MerR regulator